MLRQVYAIYAGSHQAYQAMPRRHEVYTTIVLVLGLVYVRPLYKCRCGSKTRSIPGGGGVFPSVAFFSHISVH